ncbi:DNRLRE domain-containing protein [Paenibacillus thiaminolyticus]|uniref:DNRLRE domain-containing protein n=1 Tax=Paenibacillus thiaminolyticus TaxID=49283 RepID=UPI0013F67C26|nr:DNRLRE domain-containing protein [Paenibacillus thiaminolyticus]
MITITIHEDENFLNGILHVKSPSNRMRGAFYLYGSGRSEVEAALVSATRVREGIDAAISARVPRGAELPAVLDIKYRGNEDVTAAIEAMASRYLSASIEIRPHNRMVGRVELLETPRKDVSLPPVADSTTRSDPELVTLNYGDMKSMVTGKGSNESFESFIHFGPMNELLPDVYRLEKATMKLYYAGAFPGGTSIELHQPHSIWRELGITHANKPHSVELLTDEYTLHPAERCIEVDVLRIVERWLQGELDNYGFIVKTQDDYAVTFYTRESHKPPVLQLRYIPNQVYSIGRSAIDASVFVYGVGGSERRASLTVHSDRGADDRTATLYVHQPADPMFEWQDGFLLVSRPVHPAALTVAIRKYPELEASCTIRKNMASERRVIMAASTPDKPACITVDPNISLPCSLTIAKKESEGPESSITASVPALPAYVEVSRYHKHYDDTVARLSVREERNSDIRSRAIVSNPDMHAALTIRALGEREMAGQIEVPHYEEHHASLAASRPEVPAAVDVKHASSIETYLYVKHEHTLDSTVMIKLPSELKAFLVVHAFDEVEAALQVSVPDLHGYLAPRVIGEEDCAAAALIRQRDAGDLHSVVTVGSAGGAYYYIL